MCQLKTKPIIGRVKIADENAIIHKCNLSNVGFRCQVACLIMINAKSVTDISPVINIMNSLCMHEVVISRVAL